MRQHTLIGGRVCGVSPSNAPRRTFTPTRWHPTPRAAAFHTRTPTAHRRTLANPAAGGGIQQPNADRPHPHAGMPHQGRRAHTSRPPAFPPARGGMAGSPHLGSHKTRPAHSTHAPAVADVWGRQAWQDLLVQALTKRIQHAARTPAVADARLGGGGCEGG
eukprot:350895-Chlamydomonas_euryale.AAC.7